jgi:hypothetical protein
MKSDDPIIYIVMLESGKCLTFRKKEDAEAEALSSPSVAGIQEAYLQ